MKNHELSTNIPSGVAPCGDVLRRGLPRPTSGLLLGVILMGQFMALLDVFIVNVAAPTIRADLHASGAGLQLVVAGYTIAYAVLLITGARIGGLWGYRRTFLAGLALFTVASLGCGLARSTEVLAAFRFAQGAGSALMVPQVLSLIQRLFTGPARLRAMGVYTAVISSAAAIGQVLGGILVNADLLGTSWRPVFMVNVPIGTAMLLLAPRVIPPDRWDEAERRRGLDLPGLVVLGAAVTLFTVPLVFGQQEGWPVWGWICLALSTVLFGAFVLLETQLARRGGAPLVSGRVLRAPGMGRTVAIIGLTMAVNAGFLFAIVLHLQSGLGMGALHTGLIFAPSALAFGLVGLHWRRLPQRWHGGLAVGGLAAGAIAFAWVGLLLRGGSCDDLGLFLALFVLGAGLSFSYSPTLALAFDQVRRQDAPDASGLLATVTQLGQLVGIAIFGTLFLNLLATAGPPPSAHAVVITTAVLAATTAGAAALALPRRTA